MLSNPFNKWFLPTYTSELYLFNPSREADDFTKSVLIDSRKPYVLEVKPGDDSAGSPMNARQREFVEENRERERMSVRLRPKATELKSFRPVRVVPKSKQ